MSTFAVRTKSWFPGAEEPTYSSWQTKRLIADPICMVCWGDGATLDVTIPNLKYADAFTLYVRKAKYNKSGQLKWAGDWKKAGKVKVSSGKKNTKVTISKYGKKRRLLSQTPLLPYLI